MMDRKHPFFRTFERLMAEAAAKPPVYDLGTSGRFVKEMGLVRHLFDDASYKAGGYSAVLTGQDGACDFECDIQNLANMADGEAGSVISLAVLEHVVDPVRAVRELARILQPGGIAIVSVPFFVSYHGKSNRTTNPIYDRSIGWSVDSTHEGYSDFWRFTHEGLAQLFGQAGFSRVDVFPTEGPILARLQILKLYGYFSALPLLLGILARFDPPQLGRITTMHFVRAEK